MANRNFASGGKIYSMHKEPVLIDLNYIVDSSNPNGLGIRDLKGPLVQNVFMHTSASPGLGNSNPATLNIPVRNPNPAEASPAIPASGGPPPGSPPLGTSEDFVVLGASAITNTGFSVLTGDLGLSPGTSVTGFPPGIVIGTQHITDAAAAQAQTDAMAAYLFIQALPPGTAITAGGSGLDALVLPPGTYTSASTMGLSVGATLTLDAGGDPNAIWFFQVGSSVTLNTSSVVQVINGGSAANVYWQCGASATIGVTATAVGTFIALASVSLLTNATLDGRAFALTAAVTLDDNDMAFTAFPPFVPAVPAVPGCAVIIQLEDNYNSFISGFKAIISPTSGIALKMDNSALTQGVAYTISTLGNATAAQWHALGVPAGVVPAVGVSFIANSAGAGPNTSSSRVMASAAEGSGIVSMELVGDPSLSLSPDLSKSQGFGAQIIMEHYDYAGIKACPADGTLISLSFYLNNSSVIVQGG